MFDKTEGIIREFMDDILGLSPLQAQAWSFHYAFMDQVFEGLLISS